MNIFKNKVGRPSNETIRKRRIIKISGFTLCIALVLTILLRFNVSTKLKGNVTPPNPYFDDINFYCAVVSAYSNVNYDCYNDNLSDEQLSEITNITKSWPRNEQKITSLKGIEKLINLTSLEFIDHNIEIVDLSNNPKLTYLNLGLNNISEIDLGNNTKLEYLQLSNNNLSGVDVSNLANLKELYLSSNNLSSIVFGNHANLVYLYLSENNLNTIDVSNLANLTTLNLGYNSLNEINLSNNTKLEDLVLSNNNLNTIDVSNLTNLTSLSLENNFLNSIVFGNHANLVYLYLSENNLNTIDVNNLANLEFLQLSNNNLSSIDVSNLSNLTDLYLGNNSLSSIVFGNHVNLSSLILYDSCWYNSGKEIPLIGVTLPHESNLIGYSVGDDSVIKIEDNKINTLNSGVSEIYMIYTDQYNIENSIRIGTIYVNKVTSDKYSINNNLNIIDVKSDSDDDILNNIYIDEVGYSKYNYIENDTLKICEGYTDCSRLLGEYTLIRYNSNKYDLSKGYILDNDNEFNINDIETINCDKRLNGNIVEIVYDNEVIEEIPLVSYTSSKYDLTGNYIYLKDEEFDINSINVINADKEVKNNKLVISFDGKQVVSKQLVSITSSDYDLTNNYLYLGSNNLDKSKITCDKCTIEEENNIIKVKYNNKIIDEIKEIKVSSSSYDLTSDIIKTKEFNLDNIEVINGEKEYTNNKLIIKVDNVIVKEYTIEINKEEDNNSTTVTDKKTTTIKDNTTNKTTLNKFEENAKTYDDIMKYFIIGGIAIVLVIGIVIYTKKKK